MEYSVQSFHTFGNKTLTNVAFLSSSVPGTAFRKMADSRKKAALQESLCDAINVKQYWL